ncbi:MAG TPA: glycoside hydrolase family 38 C-terminal domain-containing protein [Ktedonobacteraceae bacterium]|nr:glycoside hydrolase family 38 C-terminal domain-containing protein [Ktedonobacteraceae bacterium]
MLHNAIYFRHDRAALLTTPSNLPGSLQWETRGNMGELTTNYTVIIVPHTHWDREWYQTFQQFRMRLVRTVDKLLDIMDHDPDFSYFMLDGQTIVLDDYLEIRPEQEGRLKHYTQEGRILVGPWYLQPDEFLVSGESLVRNLQRGLQKAAEFGEPMRVGYVPDCFGHIAQLPQILQGFGIDNAVFWRGVGAEAHRSEFNWSAPDGTTIIVAHLADPIGYSNARILPLNPAEFATRVEILAANLLPKATSNTLLFMNGSDHLEPQAGLPAVIKASHEQLIQLKPEHEKILTHQAESSESNTSEKHHTHHLEGLDVRFGTLPQYIEAIRPGQANFQTLSGEMRSSQYSHLLPGVLSTRMWIKQQNNELEHLLEHWVEPLTAWSSKLGHPYPRTFIDLAWKYLLQNHPHDSICGCSIDQVHRENAARFAQGKQIADDLVTQALAQIVSDVDTHPPFQADASNGHPLPIIVFNQAPGPRTATVQARISLPGNLQQLQLLDEQQQAQPFQILSQERPQLGSLTITHENMVAAVTLSDIKVPGDLLKLAEKVIFSNLNIPEGSREITHIHREKGYILGVERIEFTLSPPGQVKTDVPTLHAGERQILALLDDKAIHALEFSVVDATRATIEFVATNLPAYGIKTFWAFPRGLSQPTDTLKAGTTPASPSTGIENSFYHVTVDPQDGTLTITDKQTGQIYAGQQRFVDGGDVGDLYTYCPPLAEDKLIGQPHSAPRIELLRDDTTKSTLRISSNWSLPRACTEDRNQRSSEAAECSIVSEVTLTPGVRRIDFHTTIDNQARDHRLRVLFPLPYRVDEIATEGTFEVRTRPVAQIQPADVTSWAEAPGNTFPQKRFVDASDGIHGLAVLNRGLPEGEVVENQPGLASNQQAIAVTLLRSIEWLSRGDLSTRRGHAGPMEYTPEAQCLGQQTFDYALVPHQGDWQAEEALVLREAQAFNLPVRVVVTDIHAGKLSHHVCLLTVEPSSVVVSAIKRAQNPTNDQLIVRLYNPSDSTIESKITPGLACTTAFVANLQEKKEKQISWDGTNSGPLSMKIRSGGIFTLLFE